VSTSKGTIRYPASMLPRHARRADRQPPTCSTVAEGQPAE
jgi:hypothetical protein